MALIPGVPLHVSQFCQCRSHGPAEHLAFPADLDSTAEGGFALVVQLAHETIYDHPYNLEFY